MITFIMAANSDQTLILMEQSDLGLYCLHYMGYESTSADDRETTFVAEWRGNGHVILINDPAHKILAHKAPSINCSRRQFQILLLFKKQIRFDIS